MFLFGGLAFLVLQTEASAGNSSVANKQSNYTKHLLNDNVRDHTKKLKHHKSHNTNQETANKKIPQTFSTSKTSPTR